MKFTVTWSRNSAGKLARLWMQGSDRRDVARAADLIDSRLRTDPLSVGESRSSRNRRITHEPPLGVMFSVNVADRTVVVLDVWLYRPPRKRK
jgi:hypothetical protein